jgi:hypothetical protein
VNVASVAVGASGLLLGCGDCWLSESDDFTAQLMAASVLLTWKYYDIELAAIPSRSLFDSAVSFYETA